MSNGNESAFPTADSGQGSDFEYGDPGLTKREYFAVMAMQGLLASDIPVGMEREAAQWSVKQADALIAELEKPQ